MEAISRYQSHWEVLGSGISSASASRVILGQSFSFSVLWLSHFKNKSLGLFYPQQFNSKILSRVELVLVHKQ